MSLQERYRISVKRIGIYFWVIAYQEGIVHWPPGKPMHAYLGIDDFIMVSLRETAMREVVCRNKGKDIYCAELMAVVKELPNTLWGLSSRPGRAILKILKMIFVAALPSAIVLVLRDYLKQCS